MSRRYLVNVIDKQTNKIDVVLLTETQHIKLMEFIKGLKPPEEKPPVKAMPQTHVCPDCGKRSGEMFRCCYCGSTKMVSIEFAEKLIGPEWEAYIGV